MRLLVWLALGLLVYLALRSRFLRRRSQFGSDRFAESAQPARPGERVKGSGASVETMVACSYCQIYLPASEAITHASAASHYFCCEEHATLYAASDKTSSRQKE